MLALAYETASSGYGVLVFAGSRSSCESDARWISKVMPRPETLDPFLVDKRMDLLSELRSLTTGVDPVLEETVLYGVAFHRGYCTILLVSVTCANVAKMYVDSVKDETCADHSPRLA